ncbi:MAG: energy-coupling factor ABC transporter permease [Alphaproteobacteria bacterium]
MHVPDGFVSMPINAATFVISGAVIGRAVVRANRTLGEKQVPLLGVSAAFIFAAQMLNFPVAGGTSGHFLGALMAAVLLGPMSSCLIMALVLTIQCLVFGDGGLTALGTNVFNMGIVGAVGGYWVFAAIRRVLPKHRSSFLVASALAAWLSVVLGAACCAVELGLSGTSPFEVALPAMVGVHAVIGVGEAIITATVISIVLAARPDLISCWQSGSEPIAAAQEE